jgi:uncharacterized protein (UPF0179 family)
MKNTVTKWILKVDDMEQVIIKEKEVSRFAPINRVLEEVGFYEFEVCKVQDCEYLIVFKPEEKQHKKSVVLVSKIGFNTHSHTLVDMTEEDRNHIDFIARWYLIQDKLIQ